MNCRSCQARNIAVTKVYRIWRRGETEKIAIVETCEVCGKMQITELNDYVMDALDHARAFLAANPQTDVWEGSASPNGIRDKRPKSPSVD